MRKFTMVLCAATMLLCYACKEQTVPAIIDDNPQKNVAMENLLTRRSVRQYTDQVPPMDAR